MVIFLPSNVASKTSHENTVAHYITPLPHPLDLHGQWEVAVSEIMVPGVSGLIASDQGTDDINSHSHGNYLVIGIWTNIVTPSYFDDKNQRVLRTVPIKLKPDKSGVTHSEFDQLQFYPISLSVVREIEVKFLLPSGSPVPFEAKRSQIVLILRRNNK